MSATENTINEAIRDETAPGQALRDAVDKASKAEAVDETPALIKDPFVFSKFAPPPLVALVRNQPNLRLGQTLVELNFNVRFEEDFEFNIDNVDAYFADPTNWPQLLKDCIASARLTVISNASSAVLFTEAMTRMAWRGLRISGDATPSPSSRTATARPRRRSVCLDEDEDIRFHPERGSVSGTTCVRASRSVTKYYTEYLHLDWEIPAEDFHNMDQSDLFSEIRTQAMDSDIDYWESVDIGDCYDASSDGLEEFQIDEDISTDPETAIENLNDYLESEGIEL